MKYWLASLVLIIASAVGAQTITSLDPSQVYSTGELVTFNPSGSYTTSPWQNVGQWGGSLTCWAPGGPGYCGPNPYVNANGYGMINFSYGYTDLYQIVNIANALPNSGSGLRVNGFNFGFTAKNGNGWDGGAQDYLAAYVSFYDSNGNQVRYYDYSSQTNQTYNWTNFYFSETFQTPYATKDLSTARYGFVGYDTNYWAGPYGPEIYNVSFSLKYSVDPCFNNPLYSPTCPGYMDALNKLLPQSTSTPTTTTSTTTTPTTTITTTVTDDPVNPTVTVVSTPVTTTTSTAIVTGSTTTSNAVAPTTLSTQKSSSANNSSTAAGLNVIARNQQREQNIVSAVVQSVMNNAESNAAVSQQEAMSIAAAAVANSTASSTTLSGQTGVGISVRSSSIGLQFGSALTQSNELSPTESVFNNRSGLLDRTNPLNEYVEQRPVLSSSASPTGSAVNRNTANNEAAAGVDLTKMATAPTGYNDYLNFTLKDVAFYAPKDVYRNQKNVDNARALRQLTNDSRHRDMVEQQYRR